MKNKEAYVAELAEMALSGESVAINKETLAPCACLKLKCDNCLLTEDDYACNDEALEAWAEAKYVPPYKLDTLVMVSDDKHTWYPRYYKGYDTAAVRAPFIVWGAGANSITAACAKDTIRFKYCRIPTDDEIAKERAKNGITEE